jgi:general secretion pathway protein A
MSDERRSDGSTATADAAALDVGSAGFVERHFGLVHHPFRLTPDLDFVYETGQFREALARLLYDVVEFGGGLSVVSGPSGVGKSTLVRALIDTLPRERYLGALVVNPLMPVSQLLATILEELGVSTRSRRKSDLLDEFSARVAALDAEGIEPVIVLDEAHTLKRHHLEEVRLLLNFEAASRKLFHVVLVGQSELVRKIRRLPALDERVTIRCHLGPIPPAEAVRYLAHRLRMAGAVEDIFTPKAATHLVKLAGGVPRRINLLASTALYVGAAERARTVTVATVDRAAADMHQEAGR